MKNVGYLPGVRVLWCCLLVIFSACGGGGSDSTGSGTASTGASSSAAASASSTSASLSSASSAASSLASSISSNAGASSSASSSLTAYSACTYPTTTSLSMGSGARTANVLATDLNRDSLLDIVGINQGNGSLGVALGTSGGGLGSVTSYSTSTVGPYEAVAADFNGDGYPDLAAANFGASSGAPYGTTISIFINKGDGTFNSYVDVSATDSSTDKLRGIATGDFNSDGYADLAVAAQSTGLHILLGKGDGTFNPHVLYAAGSSVHGVVAADFNKDGKLDVALANNSTSGKVNVLLGNGNGTFNATTAYDAGAGTFALATGDLNGDGYPDIVTANNTDNSISVLINKGSTGTSASLFNTKVDYADSSATGAVGVSIGDLHNDGKLDVLSSNNTGAVTDVYKGNGDGTLQAASPLSTGSGSYGGRIADLNRDGMPDIAVALTGGSVSILRGSCL